MKLYTCNSGDAASAWVWVWVWVWGAKGYSSHQLVNLVSIAAAAASASMPGAAAIPAAPRSMP